MCVCVCREGECNTSDGQEDDWPGASLSVSVHGCVVCRTQNGLQRMISAYWVIWLALCLWANSLEINKINTTSIS